MGEYPYGGGEGMGDYGQETGKGNNVWNVSKEINIIIIIIINIIIIIKKWSK